MIGRVISHYKIVEKLGEGGMGVVYKAEDLRLRRPVALKFLTEKALSQGQRKRFFREAQVAAGLHHPNICTIYEVDEVDDQIFLAMAFIEGRPLSRVLDDGPLDCDQALAIATNIAEALGEAHARGVVHRDIKAGNIMVTPSGSAVMLDFGLAQMGGESRLTRTGATVGTAAYMSPEQAQGEPVDRRTDIWSLGVVLYEMIVGHLPFRGEYDLAMMYNIVNEAPTPLEKACPDAPAGLQQILNHVLAKDPDDRYATAEDLARDLRRLRGIISTEQATTLITAPVFRPSGVKRRMPRRWRPWLAAAAAAVVLTGGFAAWQTFQGGGAAALSSLTIPEEKHLVVLPFENVGGQPADDAFSGGLVETLTGKLTELEQFQGGLYVVPSSEVRAEQVQSVSQARALFGVNLAVTGSVQHAADRLRLTANLVDAVTLRQIRSVTLDLAEREIASLQDGVVQRVIGLLELELNVEARKALSEGGTRTPQAYERYLRGLGYLNRYDQEGNVELAIGDLEAAIASDPDYAPAYAKLGEAYWQRYASGDPGDWAERAIQAAQRAVELNPRLAVAHATLGMIEWRRGMHDEAVETFNRALELDPLNADARRDLAGLYRSMGRLDRAEALLRESVDLRPGDWRNHSSLGVFYYRQGNYEAAEKALLEAVRLTPDNHMNYRNLAGVYLAANRLNDARSALQSSIEIQPTAKAYSNLGFVDYLQERFEDAARAFEAGIALRSNNHILWGNLGDAYRRVPGAESKAADAYRKAIDLVERQSAIQQGDNYLISKLALYQAKVGLHAEARATLDSVTEGAVSDPEILFTSAVLYELAGSRGQAYGALERAIEHGCPKSKIDAEPELEALRNGARYQNLMARLE